jgi:putative two-component system response regulator
MEQSKVREQIEKGKGTQCDPKFADIMIQMIDEDKDYRMREVD